MLSESVTSWVLLGNVAATASGRALHSVQRPHRSAARSAATGTGVPLRTWQTMLTFPRGATTSAELNINQSSSRASAKMDAEQWFFFPVQPTGMASTA